MFHHFLAAFLLSQNPPPAETVAPGLTLRHIDFKLADSKPVSLFVLDVDARHPAVNLVAARATGAATGLETTSSIATRLGATAAVNAGYFLMRGPYAGASTGAYLLDGRTLSLGTGRTAACFCRERRDVERIEFGQSSISADIVAPGGARRSLDGVDRDRKPNELILYQPPFGPSTRTPAGGIEIVLDSRGRAQSILDQRGDTPMPPSGAILSASGDAALWLRAQAARKGRWRIHWRIQPGVSKSCRPTSILGAGPRLVAAGRLSVTSEGFDHAAARHPRTALGVTADGHLLFVVADGRQPNSAGLTLDELAARMLALGAVEAFNLDGGGSTTLFAAGRIRNSPSDRRERPVSDAILIYSIPDRAALDRLPPPAAALRPEALRGLKRLNAGRP